MDGENVCYLEVLMAWLPTPPGAERCTVVGFRRDGTMWVDPALFGIGPQHAPQLAQFPGGKYLLRQDDGRRTLINAKAVVLVVTDPNWCRHWLRFAEDFIQYQQQLRQQHESARQN